MHNFRKENFSMETKDIWVQRFKEWEKSGLKRSEYCRQHNFRVSTFDYWRHRIRKESDKANCNSLVKLPVVIQAAQSYLLSIEYPTGHKIHIPANYNSDILRRLVTDLNGVFK